MRQPKCNPRCLPAVQVAADAAICLTGPGRIRAALGGTSDAPLLVRPS